MMEYYKAFLHLLIVVEINLFHWEISNLDPVWAYEHAKIRLA